jgi:hypothetical protein
VIELIVAKPETFSFDEALKKIDFYKIAAPRHFAEFTIDDTVWVRGKFEKDRNLNDLVSELEPKEGGKLFHLTPEGKIIPKESKTSDFTAATFLMFKINKGEDLGLTEDQMNALNEQFALERKERKARDADLVPEGSKEIYAYPKEVFLARMKDLGIKLPEKDGPP